MEHSPRRCFDLALCNPTAGVLVSFLFWNSFFANTHSCCVHMLIKEEHKGVAPYNVKEEDKLHANQINSEAYSVY